MVNSKLKIKKTFEMFILKSGLYFFISLLTLSSYSFASEFKYVGTSRTGDDFYLDINSIKLKRNNKVIAWHIINYNPPSNGLVASELTKLEYNCEDDIIRFLTIFAHPKKNGEGKVLAKDANIPKGDVHVPPNSQFEKMFNYICAR